MLWWCDCNFFIILILDERKKLCRLQEQNNNCYIYTSPIIAYGNCVSAISSLSWSYCKKLLNEMNVFNSASNVMTYFCKGGTFSSLLFLSEVTEHQPSICSDSLILLTYFLEENTDWYFLFPLLPYSIIWKATYFRKNKMLNMEEKQILMDILLRVNYSHAVKAELKCLLCIWMLTDTADPEPSYRVPADHLVWTTGGFQSTFVLKLMFTALEKTKY